MNIFKRKLDTYQDYEKRDNKLKIFNNFLQNCFAGLFNKQLEINGHVFMEIDGWIVKITRSNPSENKEI